MKYDLTDSEKEMLKVIKHNQQLSDQNKREILELELAYENYVYAKNATILRAGQYIDIPKLSKRSSCEEQMCKSKRVEPLTWEELMFEASQSTPYDVSFEDVLTTEEFMSAYHKIDEINAQFTKATMLTKSDYYFLIVATALQCVRQYVLNPLLIKNRLGHKESDKLFEKTEIKKGKNNRSHRWYRPTIEEIISHPVPFDTTFGSRDLGLGLGDKHRYRTLGHDPLLGWAFGTMNIATSTLSMYDMRSFHIKTGADAKGREKDKITNRARMDLIFKYSADRMLHDGNSGKLIMVTSLLKEAKHLLTDAGTKQSLPIPLVSSMVSPEFSIQLSDYGIDMASVTSEAVYASLINALVGMIHGLVYFSDKTQTDRKIYEVRTRKIILYSNIIASTSNVIATVILKNPKILDIGGLLVTISRLFSDIRFICKLKEEFVKNQLAEQFKGIADETERLYSMQYS